MKTLTGYLVAAAGVLAMSIPSSAFAWSIEGKVVLVDLRSGSPATSFIYIAPKTTFPSFRWIVRNQLDRCNNMASSAIGTGITVIFQGDGSCATTGETRSCPNVTTRCLAYKNR